MVIHDIGQVVGGHPVRFEHTFRPADVTAHEPHRDKVIHQNLGIVRNLKRKTYGVRIPDAPAAERAQDKEYSIRHGYAIVLKVDPFCSAPSVWTPTPEAVKGIIGPTRFNSWRA